MDYATRFPYPQLRRRGVDYMEFAVTRESAVPGYRIYGHSTLDGAYTAPQLMFEWVSGAGYGSPTIQSSGRFFLFSGYGPGHDAVALDIADFSALPNIPGDDAALFLRLSKADAAYAFPVNPGPILFVPSASMRGQPGLLIPISGEAPINTGLSAGDLPDGTCMRFAVPDSYRIVSIQCHHTAPLLWSTDPSIPLVPTIPATPPSDQSIRAGAFKELFVQSSDGTAAPFTVLVTAWSSRISTAG